MINDESAAGRPVRDLMIEQELTLAAYLEKLKTDLWASTSEVVIGAELLSLNIAVAEKKQVWTVGSQQPRHLVSLWGQHFVVQRLRKVPVCPRECKVEITAARGGMQGTSKPKPPPPPGLGSAQSSSCGTFLILVYPIADCSLQPCPRSMFQCLSRTCQKYLCRR